MSDLLKATDHAAGQHVLNGAEPAPKPRQTRSYQTELVALQAGVNVAISLLGSVKAEKGSADILNAAIAVLKGNK